MTTPNKVFDFSVGDLPVVIKLYIRECERPLNANLFIKALRLLRRRYLDHKLRSSADQLTVTLKTVRGEIVLRLPARNLQYCSFYFARYKYGYELALSFFIKLYLSGSSGALVDVGSNYGYYAILLATIEDYHGTYYGFEPHPSTFQELAYVRNEISRQVKMEINQLALGNSNSELYINMPRSFGCGSGNAQVDDKHGEPCHVRRFDDLHIHNIALMKIDVEGLEAAVLEGAIESVKRDSPVIIFESWKKQDMAQRLKPFRILKAQGYVFFVPCLIVSDNEGEMVVDNEGDAISFLDAGSGYSVYLKRFSPMERPIFGDHLNILAMPESRVPELDRILNKGVVMGQ